MQRPEVYRRESQSTARLEDELQSTVEDIVNTCPRFRILVLGKAGAGKSSLINAAFDVELANVSHDRAGISNINDEITSDSNPRFVLHDSQGFAPGEIENFNIIKSFIEQRNEQPELKDKLHAIWFCMEIPTEGGALFEVADQKVLELDLGVVPIIVVFTKYDLLVRKFERETDIDDDMDEEAFEELIKERAERAFELSCVRPLQETTRDVRMPPFMKVSKQPEYKNTLEQLVQLTRENIDSTVWLIWAVAQRASADVKIEASIEVGRKRYWRGLASSLSFPGKTLNKCLDALHKDIIKIWNFNDPSLYLASPEFKAMLSNLVDDLADSNISISSRALPFNAMAGVAGTVTGVVPASAPVTLPIAAVLILAQWVFLVYQETPVVLRCLMGYIVDLTIVMQSLFWLMQAKGGTRPVLCRLIKLAFKAYSDSPDRTLVHDDIKSYVAGVNFLNMGRRDRVLEKVISLIRTHRFVPRDVYKARVEAQDELAGEQDETWSDGEFVGSDMF